MTDIIQESGWTIVSKPDGESSVEFIADCYTTSDYNQYVKGVRENLEFTRPLKPYQSFRDDTCNGVIALAKEWCKDTPPF